MKTVYFVRHGESESNARAVSIYKGKESELTERAGLSIFTYGPIPHHDVDVSTRWRLRVFNDHAHLG